MEPAEPVQMNIYQRNTNRKDLRWLHFDDEPRFQDRQQGKDQQSYVKFTVGCSFSIFQFPYVFRKFSAVNIVLLAEISYMVSETIFNVVPVIPKYFLSGY